MKRILPYFFLLLLVYSCRDKDSRHTHFPETIQLSSLQYEVDGVYIQYPFRVALLDSTLYVTDLHATDYCCHAFAYPSMTYKMSFGKRGEGPLEIMSAQNVRIDAHKRVWLLDSTREKFLCYNPDSSDIFSRQVLLSKELVRTLDFDVYNDSLYVVPDYTGKHRYHLINRRGLPVASRAALPEEKEEAAQMAVSQAWRAFISYNQTNGILAMVTQLGEVMELYDVPADTIIKIVYGAEGAPRYKHKSGYAIPTGIMGYGDVHVYDSEIYALFWGHSFNDIMNQKIKIQGGNMIQVFDLKGNPVRQYVLDRNITGFCLDENKRVIVGLDVNNNEQIAVFDLNAPLAL